MAYVMVVDDEDVLAEMIAELVSDLGHEPIVLSNGQDALAALTNAPAPSLIISDIMMPRMNGIDFAKAVRSNAQLAHVPIILMSAAGRPRVSASANHFLTKPFDLGDLAQLIEDYIAGT